MPENVKHQLRLLQDLRQYTKDTSGSKARAMSKITFVLNGFIKNIFFRNIACGHNGFIFRIDYVHNLHLLVGKPLVLTEGHTEIFIGPTTQKTSKYFSSLHPDLQHSVVLHIRLLFSLIYMLN